MRDQPQQRDIAPKLIKLTALAAGLASAGVTAQAPENANDSVLMEEVIVTATRRDERMLDVPAPVSVISPTELAQSGAKDLGDYVFAVPGVNYNKGGVAGRGEITMRGVSTGNLTTPTVGIYVDEVPVGSAVRFADGTDAYDQRLLDLGRIEILKGPQGTLFGVSSMGGLLKYVTEQPVTDGMYGKIGADVSTTEHGGVNPTINGVLNEPLSSNTALRVAGFYQSDDGYVDALGPKGGNDVNSGDVYGARLSVLHEATDRLSFKAAAQFQQSRQDGLSFVDYDQATQKPIYGDLEKGPTNYDEKSKLDNSLYTFTVDYDMDWAVVSSITGYQKQSIDSTRDFTAIYQFFDDFIYPIPFDTTVSLRHSKLEKVTQEIRLVSQAASDWQWQAGVFYTHEDGDLDQTIVQTLIDGTVADGVNVPYVFGPNAGFDSTYEEIAAYGTVDWFATDRITITAGVRAARNEIDVLQINGGLQGTTPDNRQKTNESPVTYLGAIKYALSDSSNLYARVATGYRAGGPNTGLADPITGAVLSDAPTYDSDSLINYELGYKGRHWDGRFVVDGSVYFIDWSDIQQAVVRNGVGYLSNAGEAEIKGAELALMLEPVDGLTLSNSFSYIDAELTENADESVLQVPSGSRLPNSPKFSANLSAQYDFSLMERQAFVRAEYIYLGDRYSSFKDDLSNPNYELDSFGQTDLSAGIEFEKFSLGAYVRNLTDERGELSAETNQSPFGLPTYVTLIRPRTVGLTVGFNF